jgi:hypothetical protein
MARAAAALALREPLAADWRREAGELELTSGESARSVKVRLRRAASRVGAEVQIWDADGKVYFMRGARRGRPRKARG